MIGDGDYGEIVGMKIGRGGNRSTRRKNLPQRHFVRHKSCIKSEVFMEARTDIAVLWILIPFILCPSSTSARHYQTRRYHQKENHKKKNRYRNTA
jgi:hypothetical protein